MWHILTLGLCWLVLRIARQQSRQRTLERQRFAMRRVAGVWLKHKLDY